ncbi:hypothetical protein BaRGS_00034719, partial [Batillaria attramentaria]
VTYNIPDQVWTVSDLPSGSFASAGTVMMTSSDVRKSYSVNAGVDVQTKKFGFSASASYSKTQSTLLKNTRKTTSVHASFSSRRVDFVPKTELRFGARAQTAVNALPSSYTSNPGAYEEFIRQFGTHYITWGKFGGIMMMYLETSTSYIEKKNIEEVSAQASATFGQVLTVKGGTSHSTTQIDSSFTSATNSLIRYYGGTANLMAEKGLSAWQPTISAQPWLFSTKLVRLSELVRDANKKDALDQAISDYLMRVYLNVELRRVLNTLPSHMRSRSEVTSLNSRITTMVAKYPLVESEVDALGKEAMDTVTVYFKLFLEEDLSQEELFYANSLMNKVDFSCPTGQSIFEIQSWHSDWHDDRRWAFKCSYLKDLYALGNCYWTAPVLICQKFLPLLKKAAESRSSQLMSCSKAAIINVSSVMSSIDSSLKTRGNSYHYRASKAALNMVTALMSVELKSFGILAAAIHPGWVKTDMGGPGADLDKDVSIRSCWSTITSMSEKSSGLLHNYDGKIIP